MNKSEIMEVICNSSSVEHLKSIAKKVVKLIKDIADMSVRAMLEGVLLIIEDIITSY